MTPANQPPISFNLPIDTSKVDPRRSYAVEAMLIDGERRYLPVLQYPVLTNKAPSQVEIVVAPEATPAEKMYEDFKRTFGQIGAMKTFNGSALNDAGGVAWDAFTQNNKIKVGRRSNARSDITYSCLIGDVISRAGNKNTKAEIAAETPAAT